MHNMLYRYNDPVTWEIVGEAASACRLTHLVRDRQVVAVGEPSLAPPDALETPDADWAGKQAVGSP